MKRGNRLAALALVLACLAAMVLPVSAANFKDLETHWAKSYMEDLYERGYLTGYTDNTMRPEEKITACETLVFLSRFYSLNEQAAADVYEDYGKLVEEIVPKDKAWAYDEIALCLASGIVTERELRQLDLSRPVAKEYLAVCLIRAMQLVEEAAAFEEELTFDDTESIAASYRSYIALLVDMGVVTGDTKNKFEPRSGVSRAVCATMISRALDYAEANNLEITLKDYPGAVPYAALISQISGSTVRVRDFSGIEREYLITFDTNIAIDGKSASLSSCKVGDYVDVGALGSRLVSLDVTREETVTWTWGFVNKVVNNRTYFSLNYQDLQSGEEKSFAFSSSLPVTIDGTQTSYTSLKRDQFAILRLKDGVLDSVSATSEVLELTGEITEITYGSQVSIRFSAEDMADRYIFFDIRQQPALKRGDTVVALDSLRVGDTISVVMTSGYVTSITAGGEKVVVAGQITAITTTTSGTFWTIEDETGKQTIYTLDASAVVIKNGAEVKASTAAVGDLVEAASYDNVLLQVTIQTAASDSSKIAGMVLDVDVNSRIATVLCGSKLIYVKVDTGTTILSVLTGNTLNLTSLPTDRPVTIYGSYKDASNFTAVSIVVDG